MKAQDFFAGHSVFTHAEFMEKEEPRSAKTRESLLAYYIRTGRILRVRRGLYVAVPAGVDAKACPVDPYLLAAKMTDDAVLAYHTALEFYGKAYSVRERFLYLTSRASRPLTFRAYNFRAALIPKKLRDKHQELFAVNRAERLGVNIKVASLERTLVDMLDRPDLSGSWEEIWRSLEAVEFFDLDKVVEYALLLENATTIAKVGFFLEQRREPLMVEEAHLKALHKQRPRRPHYLIRGNRSSGHLLTKWNLVVPSQILERSWREAP